MTTLAPRPLTADECTILAVVADAAAGQGRRDPLVSRTSVLRAADNRGLPKMAGRAAWYSLIESGAVVPVDDGEGDAFAPYPRPYVVAPWAAVAPSPAPSNPGLPGRPGAAQRASGYVCRECLQPLPAKPTRDGRCGPCHAAAMECTGIGRQRRRTIARKAQGGHLPGGNWS